MLAEVKKCAENHDIKGLRYIFVDSLDVDPTFEKYKEDFEYCKSIPGMFDGHQALSGILTDERKWTISYWEQLKIDLMKNFSQKRFEHMIEVAKVVYADKIARLRKERAERRKRELVKEGAEPKPSNQSTGRNSVSTGKSPKAAQDELIERRMRELAESEAKKKAQIEAKQKAQIEARRKSVNEQRERNGGAGSKKALGIALIVVIIVVVALVVMALQ